MDEWVIVTFPETREVFIDSRLAGSTNIKLKVERGHHVFRLGGTGYRPPSVEMNVTDTSEEFPMVIVFERV